MTMNEQKNSGKQGAEHAAEKPVVIPTCDSIRELLTDYIARELGDSQSALVREHLKNCRNCETAAREIAAPFDLLRAAGKMHAGFPDRLSDKHHARLKRAFMHPIIGWIERNHFLVSLVAAAVFVTISVVTLSFFTLSEPSEAERTVHVSIMIDITQHLAEPLQPGAQPAPFTPVSETEPSWSDTDSVAGRLAASLHERGISWVAIVLCILLLILLCAVLARRVILSFKAPPETDGMTEEGPPPFEQVQESLKKHSS